MKTEETKLINTIADRIKTEREKHPFIDWEIFAAQKIYDTLITYWQEKQKANIENLFSDQNFINNLCFSFRHDYGLLDSNEREIIKFECSEWLRAIINNWKEIE